MFPLFSGKIFIMRSLLFGLLCSSFCYLGQAQNDRNLVLITLDGLRWEELFGGAVDSIMLNKELTAHHEEFMSKFSGATKEDARVKLMPFFWNEIGTKGQLYGNRWEDNKVNCTNRFWFSYPGYSEILCGYSDGEINSNAKKYNKNVTVLEWLNEKEDLKGRVSAFASWDVFPYIINDERSGIPVNAGFRKCEDVYLSIKEQFLNEFQDQVSGPWYNVRLDAFTHNYMIEHMKKHHPRVIFISYGETDDFAHDGEYDKYLLSAHKTDNWIKELWEYISSDDFYAGKTNLLITTDHGRGSSPMTEWKSHGTIFKGSNAIWIAAIGPDIKALGEVKSNQQLFQDQIARTAAKLLGYDYEGGKYKAGEVINGIVE